ncbi:major facilitator superfamily domain-containing protein [Leucosporidium creatinivorum]|uniref:Major facilitator superfamily domain-containing protein n=1 Tax=Leucosporidium creatinivorum TaxID=106004 RepID=A0A1Y2F3M8_9BASI|nr:major facilitator superfamily domain-containing protein [Leucosporidium creatinivorum]
MSQQSVDDKMVDEKTTTPTNLSANEAPLDSELYIDPKEEKKLLRKLDFFLISLLGTLYLLSFLDRSNIGNANIAGLSTDLGLVGNQYGAAVSVVYSTYVAFEPVWSNLLKVIGAKRLMTVSTLLWGAVTTGTAFVKNWDQLMAVRVLLGAFEAGLFPCVNMYLAMSYRPDEQGKRLSYVFVCAAISGAFGGLLAFGLTQIKGGSLASWQYLYLVEGIISLSFAPIIYFMLPNTLDKAWWLNRRERELCVIRYEINRKNYDVKEKFSWGQVKLAALDWKTWSHSVNQFCVDTTLYGLTTFMPVIIKGLNLTKNTVDAQLLTVPVYFVAATSYVIGAHYSDKYQNRSLFIILYMAIAAIGYLILAIAESTKVRFGGVFVVGLSLYGAVGLNVTWVTTNTAGHFRRATSVGLMQLVGNSSGAAIGFIYNAKEAPRYNKGLWIAFSLSILSIIITALHAFALRRINARRAELVAAGAADQQELGSDNPHFKFML